MCICLKQNPEPPLSRSHIAMVSSSEGEAPAPQLLCSVLRTTHSIAAGFGIFPIPLLGGHFAFKTSFSHLLRPGMTQGFSGFVAVV